MSDPAGLAMGDVSLRWGREKGESLCKGGIFPSQVPQSKAWGCVCRPWLRAPSGSPQCGRQSRPGCVCTRTRNVCFSLLTFSGQRGAPAAAVCQVVVIKSLLHRNRWQWDCPQEARRGPAACSQQPCSAQGETDLVHGSGCSQVMSVA